MIEVTLCGILYRVTRPEPWAVVFTEAMPVAMRPTRFMLHRDPHRLWEYAQSEGWGDVSVCHIMAAYEWCLARVGGDHDQTEITSTAIVPHK